MKISTKGRYALRIMIDLAKHQSDDFVTLKDIANRQEMSEKYLESIIKVLVKNQILVGLRGKGGGYKLTKPVEEYTVWDILNVSEDHLLIVDDSLMHNKSVLNDSDKKILAMWDDLNVLISDYFKGISISSLIAEESGNDYII
ncbi:MAG: Rrf2 family transcriptional regulator [Lachnospiraceae bacterium]|nr:MAG: Rrf2 family transcriptional regulator [Lachnospiraceae bacterium]